MAVNPFIIPGVEGTAVTIYTGMILAALVPHVFTATTEIFPLVAVPLVDTVIEFVPCPDVMVHPEGGVHVYEVALGTAAIL